MEIIVDKVTYQFPERLTIEQWQHIMQWDFTIQSNWPKIIAYVTDIPQSLLERGNEEALELGAALIVQQCNARQQTKMKPVNELNFGEFVDLDCWMAIGVTKHLRDIATMLVPNTDWADEALWAIEQWSNYRTGVFRQYAELFGLNEVDDDDIESPVNVDKLAVARNWYKIIVDLANDDVLKIDEITEQPLIKIFNFMALRKEKQEIENMKIREQNMKLKTQR